MFCDPLLGVVLFVMSLGPIRLSPSFPFREVLRGIRASLVGFCSVPCIPVFLSSFVYFHGSGSFLCFAYRG